MENILIRPALIEDLEAILSIYNEGIEDRIATLETNKKEIKEMMEWFHLHQGRYQVLIAQQGPHIIGWASLNKYNPRDAYKGVADLSIYIKREYRGRGVGSMLLNAIESSARENDFYKIILFTFPFNELGQGLYRKKGYREVGIFQQQGIMDGKFVDVMAMEKLL